MNNRLIAIIGGFAMTGLVIMAEVGSSCIYNDAIILSPEVEIRGQSSKICFALESDYQIFRREKLRQYHIHPIVSDTSLGYFGDNMEELGEFILMLSEETERGNINMTNIDTSGGVISGVRIRLIAEIQSLVGGYDFVDFPELPPQSPGK